MATQAQIEFVEAIERSVKALVQVNSKAPNISAIMEDSGHNTTELYSYVMRIREGGGKDLLSRLRTAFEGAKKMPLCLEDVEPMQGNHFEVNTPFLPEPIYTITGNDGANSALNFNPIPSKTVQELSDPEELIDDAIQQVSRLLRPLNVQNRKKVIMTTMYRYGVGE